MRRNEVSSSGPEVNCPRISLRPAPVEHGRHITRDARPAGAQGGHTRDVCEREPDALHPNLLVYVEGEPAGYLRASPPDAAGTVALHTLELRQPHANVGTFLEALGALLELPDYSGAAAVAPAPDAPPHLRRTLTRMTNLCGVLAPVSTARRY